MEEFNIQGKQTSFYKYCPGTFGYTLVSRKICNYAIGNRNRNLLDCSAVLHSGSS